LKNVSVGDLGKELRRVCLVLMASVSSGHGLRNRSEATGANLPEKATLQQKAYTYIDVCHGQVDAKCQLTC
jgi:hypothetical protein